METPIIKIGGQFSGVGAFDFALDRLGIKYENIYQAEWDKYARQTYLHNHSAPKWYVEDVYDTPMDDIPQLDVAMFSPPCQAFSLAGKRKGEDDKRGVLFYNSHEFIQKNKPRYFIFENVKGLLSDDSGKTFQRWIDMLGGKSVNGNPVIFPHEDATPYHVYYQVLNAKNYGVPQNRERIFIIGIRDDADNNFSFPKPFHLEKRLKEVLETDVDEKYFLSDKNVSNLIKFNQRQIDNGTGFSAKFRDINITKTMDALKCGGGGKDDLIKVKSATKQGFEVASEDRLTEYRIAAIRGRNPENTNDRTTGAPTEQRLEINHNGTSNTLTSVQKDNVVIQINSSKESGGKQPYQQNRVYDSNGISTTLCRDKADINILEYNNLFNTNKNIIFNGNKTQDENIRETLFALQQEIGAEEISTWGLRIMETVREQEILQSKLHEEGVQGKTKKTSKRIINKVQPCKSTKSIAQIIMRCLPKETWERCSSQRRKSIKQLIRQLNESLQIMSHEDSQTKIKLQNREMQYQSEGVGLLRKTLSEIQEIWESTNGKTQSIQQNYRIRRLTVREAFRLMDFPDTFTWPVSNSQAYKQAGNSIVVNVLTEILRKFNL